MKRVNFMKQHRLYVVALVLLNSACGQLPVQTDTDKPSEALTPSLQDNYQIPTATRLEQDEHPFGQSALSNQYQRKTYSDSVHSTLLGFFSENNNAYTQAAEYFYQAAETAQDATLARNAVNSALYASDKALTEKSTQLYKSLSDDVEQAQQLSVISLFVNEKPAEALAELEQLLARTGHISAKNLDLLIKLLAQHPDKAEALLSVERMRQKHPEDQELNYVYARLLLYLKRYEDSLPALEQVLKQDPEHKQVLALYLEVLQKLKQNDKALAFLKKQVRKNPKHIETQVQYARLLLELERYKAARRHFAPVLKKQKDSRLLHALGLLYLQHERYDDAKRHLKRLLKHGKLSSERETARYFLGQIASKQNQIDKALAYYQQIKPGEQHYFNARLHQVLLLKEQGKMAEALSVLTETHPHSQEQDELLIKLEAEIHLDAKNYDKALAVYTRGLESQPDNLDLLYMQGMLAEQADQLLLSEQSFRKVLEKDPKNIDAINALGYTLADRTDRYDEAYALIKQAYDLKPDAYYILDSMGWVLYRQGKYTEALEYLQKALDAKFDPEIAAHLGEVLWASGDKAAAQALWEKALKSFPNDEHLQQVMQKFLR